MQIHETWLRFWNYQNLFRIFEILARFQHLVPRRKPLEETASAIPIRSKILEPKRWSFLVIGMDSTPSWAIRQLWLLIYPKLHAFAPLFPTLFSNWIPTDCNCPREARARCSEWVRESKPPTRPTQHGHPNALFEMDTSSTKISAIEANVFSEHGAFQTKIGELEAHSLLEKGQFSTKTSYSKMNHFRRNFVKSRRTP